MPRLIVTKRQGRIDYPNETPDTIARSLAALRDWAVADGLTMTVETDGTIVRAVRRRIWAMPRHPGMVAHVLFQWFTAGYYQAAVGGGIPIAGWTPETLCGRTLRPGASIIARGRAAPEMWCRHCLRIVLRLGLREYI